mgnify:CR=1 FL=1|tara:strand:+ start:566 stop:745 length:180 start_codon:yes stop_codon:yes gene_type:complete
MKDLIENISSHLIEEINEHIDEAISWQLDASELDGDEFYDLALKVKQQILFSLIKKVTK